MPVSQAAFTAKIVALPGATSFTGLAANADGNALKTAPSSPNTTITVADFTHADTTITLHVTPAQGFH